VGTGSRSAGEEPAEPVPEAGEIVPVIDETVVIARPPREAFDFLMLSQLEQRAA